MKKHLMIFGYGFTSEAIGERLQGRFSEISGTTRSKEKARALKHRNIVPVLFDGTNADEALLERLSNASHLLVSIGPDAAGDPVLNALTQHGEKLKHLEWIGYLSTVGVYGDHEGAWVDENTACKPVSRRSRERVTAENAWLKFCGELDIPLAIFRLSGIYGPGRNTFLNIEKGNARRLVKPGQVFNRIHREDIAKAVDLAIEKQTAGIFNITDDMPAPPQDVVTFAYSLTGKTPPQEIDFASAELTAMARSFYGENKRVSNARSKEVLGMVYDWPDYKTSLRRMHEEGSWKAR